MQNGLESYMPVSALPKIIRLLEQDDLVVKIKTERKTRHGDYRRLSNGKHQITVNSNLNKYRFLITLIHEIAHFEAYKTYGRTIKPHGREWKSMFQRLMLPFINPEVFPEELLPLLAKHFKSPRASSDTDIKLALALKQYDAPNDKTFIFDVPIGKQFRLYNGRVFQRGKKRRIRYECVEIKTGKLYLFNPNAEVELLDE